MGGSIPPLRVNVGVGFFGGNPAVPVVRHSNGVFQVLVFLRIVPLPKGIGQPVQVIILVMMAVGPAKTVRQSPRHVDNIGDVAHGIVGVCDVLHVNPCASLTLQDMQPLDAVVVILRARAVAV